MSTSTYDLAVCIGRFQPFHLGHLALLRQALGIAQRCVVVVGSAWQPRTPKNPWTWEERAEMIREALPEADRGRIEVVPMRDYYNQQRWVAAVRKAVGWVAAPAKTIALVGHFKDATSAYLSDFPQWKLVSIGKAGEVDGTPIRDALFGAAPGQVDAALARLANRLPPNTTEFLRNWAATGDVEHVAEEWRMLRKYKAEWASAPYPPVFVTVDTVVRCHGKVLLIRRGQAPGKGLLAVPGGFLEERDTVYQSAVRELEEETNFALLAPALRACLKEVAVFDHPDRSQRGRTITHAHYFDLGERELPAVQAGDDAHSVDWVAIGDLAGLEDQFHDDHFHMLDHFLGLTQD
jgi:bifunctional NMN adenylyltransferase/nudix hydrolase